MSRILTFLAALVTLYSSVTHAQVTAAPQVDTVLDRLSEKLPNIRGYLNERETAPEEGGWFRRSRQDVQDDLNLLLDQILGVIVGEEYQSSRRKLFELEDDIGNLDLEIGELSISRTKAQPSPADLNPVDQILQREFEPGSREAISAEIADKENQMQLLVAERDALISNFRQSLLEMYAIALSNDQARSLLYQINGGSIVEASVTYAILQQIQARLAEIRSTSSNEEIQRRYYGMAAALSLVAVRLHERHFAQYVEDWLPKIDDLDEEQQSLIAETRAALGVENNANRRGSYENNLAIQENVASVIGEYRDLLTDRQQMVRVYLTEAEKVAVLAVNTLKTLENAIILHSQFTWNEEEFQALREIDSMELIPLNNAEITESYLDLSRQVLDLE